MRRVLGQVMVPLETDRLQLRPFTLEDLEDLHSIVGEDPDMSWAGEPRFIEDTANALQRRLNHYERCGFGLLAVVCKTTGKMIGQTGLQIMKETTEVELVSSIAKPCWRRGIALEACARLLAHGFLDLNLSRIVANTRSDNARAQGLLHKLGFEFVREHEAYGHRAHYYELSKHQQQ